jgi:hypothetical protein
MSNHHFMSRKNKSIQKSKSKINNKKYSRCRKNNKKSRCRKNNKSRQYKMQKGG